MYLINSGRFHDLLHLQLYWKRQVHQELNPCYLACDYTVGKVMTLDSYRTIDVTPYFKN